MDDRRLAFIRELERADEAVAAVLADLDQLYAACEAVRERALELEASLARLPDERAAAALVVERASAAVVEARAAAERAAAVLVVERARAAVVQAHAAAERAAAELRVAKAAGEDERIAAARRFDVRARDALRVAERRLREAGEHEAQLEAQAAAAERESQELGERARELAAVLAERPRLAAEAGAPPQPGLAGIAEWGTRARAALLVARAQLAAERDGVVRQANELATLVLGEPLNAGSAAGIARQVERQLGAR